jgi:hypothetical protein
MRLHGYKIKAVLLLAWLLLVCGFVMLSINGAINTVKTGLDSAFQEITTE